MPTDSVLIAYVAPEVALPLMSAFAGVVGFLMMIGRAPFRMAARGIRKVTGRGETPAPKPEPASVEPHEAP